MASHVSILYIIVQDVYKTSVHTRLDPMAFLIGMRVVRFVHLAYEVLQDLLVCGYSLWSLYDVVCLGAV